MILKFTTAGKFVLQIGKRGQSSGDADTMNVHQPADVFVHAASNELYVADGYGNHRVIVFDADSGQVQAHVGRVRRQAGAARADRPADSGAAAAPANPEGPSQYGLVHAVKVSNDGMVYVADRVNNRIQVFTTEGKYLRQVKVTDEGGVTPVPAGFAFSPDARQQFLYVVDSGPMRVVDLRPRDTDPDRRDRHARSRSPATSTSSITWRPTRRATSIRRRSSPIAARRDSCCGLCR